MPGQLSLKKGHLCSKARQPGWFWVSLKRLINFMEGRKSNNKEISQLTNAEYHLSSMQIAKIINAASSPRDKILVQLLAETGLRRAEAVNLQIADLNFETFLILVRRGKGNKSRYVPMTASLCLKLREFVSDKHAGFLFKSSRGDGLSSRQVNRIVAKVAARAGVVNPNPKYCQVTPHLFRHSFARLWKDRGGSIEALSKIMGHQSTKTTWDLYGTMSLNDIEREYGKIMTPKVSRYKKF